MIIIKFMAIHWLYINQPYVSGISLYSLVLNIPLDYFPWQCFVISKAHLKCQNVTWMIK
jgi:hypothetical protein